MSQPQGASVQAIFRAPSAGFLGRAREGGIIYPFIILFVVLAIWKGSTFYGKTNLLEILDQQSATMIIAVAGTMVLIGGGIDLSVGATYALCQVIATKMAITGNPVLAIIVGVLIGLGVGGINGLIATFFRINSLIATLAMSFVITGAAALITNGNLIIAYSALGFANFARTSFLDVTTAAWTMIGVIIILGIVLSRTIAGRYIYAAGSNAEAARLAGVRVQWIKLVTFAISGGAAALGGILDASRVLSASSANGGTALTFTVLAGIVVGGTSILGGEGAIWRTVVGVLFIALIGNGFTLLAWNPLYEQITLGVILLLAVGGDAWSRLRTT
jgi:ribose transport system permease protein